VNPFAVLGLPERPDLDDDTIDGAWLAIAAATHPDRPDGGDLARYTQATAAHAELASPWGRSEAYADLVQQARAEGRYDAYPDQYPPGYDPRDCPPPPGRWQLPPPLWLADPKGMLLNLPWRFRHGHPAGMLAVAAVIAAVCLGTVTLFPRLPRPAVAAAGIVWFVPSAREALAPPPGQ
jgi:hypothetical protein